MIGAPIHEEGLGFGFKKLLDPRKRLKRHLKFAKKSLDPREHLKFAKKSLDPRQHLKLTKRLLDPREQMKLARRGLDPAGFFSKKRHRTRRPLNARQLHQLQLRHPALYARIMARRAHRLQRGRGALPSRVTMAVQSDEARAALGDLGIKFKIPRKWRKRIAIAAAVGAAAYFGGAPLVAKFGTKALAKKGGMMAGKAVMKKGRKKLSAKRKKKLKKAAKQLIQMGQTAAITGTMQPIPGSVASGGNGGQWVPSDTGSGGAGIPSGAAPGPEGPGYDDEGDEVSMGISSKAGFGGIPPAVVLGGLAVGAFILLGGKRR